MLDGSSRDSGEFWKRNLFSECSDLIFFGASVHYNCRCSHHNCELVIAKVDRSGDTTIASLWLLLLCCNWGLATTIVMKPEILKRCFSGFLTFQHNFGRPNLWVEGGFDLNSTYSFE